MMPQQHQRSAPPGRKMPSEMKTKTFSWWQDPEKLCRRQWIWSLLERERERERELSVIVCLGVSNSRVFFLYICFFSVRRKPWHAQESGWGWRRLRLLRLLLSAFVSLSSVIGRVSLPRFPKIPLIYWQPLLSTIWAMDHQGGSSWLRAHNTGLLLLLRLREENQ